MKGQAVAGSNPAPEKVRNRTGVLDALTARALFFQTYYLIKEVEQSVLWQFYSNMMEKKIISPPVQSQSLITWIAG